jgi:hypothetical protein
MINEDEDGDDNDAVEDDGQENNDEEGAKDGQQNNDEGETDAREAKANEEEEDEEENPCKQAETKMLLAKTKLLLLEQRKRKDGGLRRGDARSEQRLISKVRELRDWLAKETRKQEAADGKEKKKSGRNRKAKPDPNKLWAIHGIIKETTYHYLVVWKGDDEHGQPWDDSWVAKGEVNASAKHDWAALRREVASHKKKKREEWEALEEARKKAEGRRRASSRVQGRAESEDEDEDENGDEDEDEDEDGDEDE